MLDQPKLAPSDDGQWREFYENKCREQREEIERLRHGLNQIAWPTEWGLTPEQATSEMFRHIAQDTLAIGVPVANTRADKRPRLCYPFSVDTCDDPKCTCRSERAAAAGMPEPRSVDPCVFCGKPTKPPRLSNIYGYFCGRECFDAAEKSPVAMRPLSELVEDNRKLLSDGQKAHDLIADALGWLIPQSKVPTPNVLAIREAVAACRRATTYLPYLPIGKP